MLSQLLTILILPAAILATIAINGLSCGVSNQTHERPLRLEINDFAGTGPAFDLYIQALQAFQATNHSDPSSYFQIAGIHGYPLVPWDGVEPVSATAMPTVGYCPHSSNLFPSWHRPYMALYEQTLWNHVQSIAVNYPSESKDTYMAAVPSWRMPYWDWASNAQIPSVAMTPTISINTPNGTQNISNPLYAYDFGALPRSMPYFGSDFDADYQRTIRHPSTNASYGGTGQQQDSLADAAMVAQASVLHTGAYQLLSQASSYNSMACDSNPGQSLESLHDQVHIAVGGIGGHMSYLQWSAFDPIFWLHHANVDRFFAIWQALYPEESIQPQTNPPNFVVPSQVGSNMSSLYPLHADAIGTFHTPGSASQISYFGYSYPELRDWYFDNGTLYSAAVRIEVNQLYNSALSNGTTYAGRKLRRHTKQKREAFDMRLSNPELLELQANNLPSQWAISVKVPKSTVSFPGSFSIYFYLGSPPAGITTSASLFLAPNLLGTYAVFSDPVSSPANGNSRRQSTSVTPTSPDPADNGVLSQGLVPITAPLAALVQNGVLPNLDVTTVGPLLQSELNWTASGGTGDAMLPQGLNVEVQQRDVVPAASLSDFPSYGAWNTIVEATAGKEGGVQEWVRVEEQRT